MSPPTPLDKERKALLQAVRDWPMTTTLQLAGRLGRSERQTAGLIRKALAAGELQRVRLSDRTAAKSRYLLTDAGLQALARDRGVSVPAYAAHFGLSRRRHQRALMQAETTWWLYQLLRSLKTQGSNLHIWAHAPVQLLTSLRSGKHVRRIWPLALGIAALGARHGDLESGASYRPLVIEWDDGHVRVEAYRRRLAAYYRWHSRLMSAEHERPDQLFPVLVMLTTTSRRATQLLLVWEAVAAEHGSRPLPLFVAPWREALSSPAAWRRPASPTTGGRLLAGCPADACADPHQAMAVFGFPALEAAAAGPSPDRRRILNGALKLPPGSTQVASDPGRANIPRTARLHNVPRIEGLHSPVQSRSKCDIASRTGRSVPQYAVRQGVQRTAGLVQVQLSLSPDGRRLLDCIASWPLLSRHQLAAVTELKSVRIRDELRRLQKLGLVSVHQMPSIGDEADEYLYHLTPTGISFQAATRGATAAWYALGRRWPFERIPGSRQVKLRLASLTVPLKHTQLTRWLFMRFLLTARRYQRERMLDHQLVVWEESEARRHFTFRSQQRVLAPDAAGVYRIGRQIYEFLVESDMGTRHTASLIKKFQVFRDYRDSLAYAEDHVRLPRLLVVTAGGAGSAVRVRALAAAVTETRLAEGKDCPELKVLITSRDALEDRGLNHPVWLNPASGRRQHCFAGFKTVPDSARLKLDLRQLQSISSSESRI